MLQVRPLLTYRRGEPDWVHEVDAWLYRKFDIPFPPVSGTILIFDNDHCHSIHVQSLYWNDAKQRCELYAVLELACPESPLEFELEVKDFLKLGWTKEPT
jgi:hypothetical protein